MSFFVLCVYTGVWGMGERGSILANMGEVDVGHIKLLVKGIVYTLYSILIYIEPAQIQIDS